MNIRNVDNGSPLVGKKYNLFLELEKHIFLRIDYSPNLTLTLLKNIRSIYTFTHWGRDAKQ